MKKKLTMLLVASAVVFGGCKYDDSDLWDSVNGLDSRITTLEQKLNTEIATLKSLIDAIESGTYVSEVTSTASGHTLTLSDGTVLTVNHGTPGTSAPVIGVQQDEEDGLYYWTLTVDGETSFLCDESAGIDRFCVTGETGPAGATLILGVDAGGYWTVKYSESTSPVQILGSDGQPVKATATSGGDSLFSGMTQDDSSVTFTLTAGGSLTLLKSGGVACSVAEASDVAFRFLFGQTRNFTLVQTGVESLTIAKPDGWKVAVSGNTLTVTAPDATNAYAEAEGAISLIAVGNGKTVITNVDVQAGAYNYVITGEGIDSKYLASDAYGTNLYTAGYEKIFDAATSLEMHMTTDGYYFSSGGITASQFNDMTSDGFTNQCSVYYRDPVTGKGGHNGSETFFVSYGNNNPMFFDSRTSMYFTDASEHVFDHFWVTNSTYAALSMKNGDGFAQPHNYTNQHYFYLTVDGYDAGGGHKGTVTFYLSDFRTQSSPELVTEWTKVDLSSLGKVNKLVFDLQGSDDNGYGVATPAYFCMDDIALRIE